MNDIYPTYATPCVSERKNSLDSVWLYPSDFGECYPPPSDHLLYPRVTPVYNGEVLDIKSEFVHASLSGISIKHYYGKCFQQEEAQEEEEGSEYEGEGGKGGGALMYEDQRAEGNNADLFDYDKESPSMSKGSRAMVGSNFTPPSSGSFEYRESFYAEGQPPCTLQKINCRNSFWNIHRPELCKLTWGQKYVGRSTVIGHLHEHLMYHGAICEGFHSEEARAFMLNRELDDYVRLKVVACPRKLPPDEPAFNFKETPRVPKSLPNSRCKYPGSSELKKLQRDERSYRLSEDEDEAKEKTIHRSKEEFCLTIGKHIRKPPIVQPEPLFPEDYYSYALPCGEEEEEGDIFFYNWLLYCGEESYEHPGSVDDTVTATLSDLEILPEPCAPLMMDEFCRAAGKVDFSDIRCDPDF